MILVVGHGPSSNVDPDWIDRQSFVIRLFTGTHKHPKGTYSPHIGTKVDAIIATRPRNIIAGYPFWYEGDYRDRCREIAAPYTDKKLSTGTSGCLMAHLRFPGEEIGVIGFDATLHGFGIEKPGDWPFHDAKGEGKLLRSIGIKDYGNYGEDV